jgi:hypothetical protein
MPSIDIARERLRNQCLQEAVLQRPEHVVRWLGAVQAQEFRPSKWALAQRTAGVSEPEVDQALADGKILRIHVLRPTWHYVAAEDIRWITRLSAPRVHASMAFMNRQLGLVERDFKRGNEVIARTLEGGKHLTRDELREGLVKARLPDPVGTRLAHYMAYAELEGLICSGARRGKQHTYALVDERVPRTPIVDRDAALAELTLRYFRSRGPATPHDFAMWSGLTVADAKAGLEMNASALERVTHNDKTLWFASLSSERPSAASIAHLLPIYDEYPACYKDRNAAMGTGFVKATGPKGDVPFTHPLLLDGLVNGYWKSEFTKREVVVSIHPYRPLNREAMACIGKAAERYGKFLALPVTLKQAS